MRWVRSLIIREGIGIGLNIKEKNARKRMEYKPFKDARYESEKVESMYHVVMVTCQSVVITVIFRYQLYSIWLRE